MHLILVDDLLKSFVGTTCRSWRASCSSFFIWGGLVTKEGKSCRSVGFIISPFVGKELSSWTRRDREGLNFILVGELHCTILWGTSSSRCCCFGSWIEVQLRHIIRVGFHQQGHISIRTSCHPVLIYILLTFLTCIARFVHLSFAFFHISWLSLFWNYFKLVIDSADAI